MRVTAALSRRLVLRGLVASAALGAVPARAATEAAAALGAGAPDALLIAVADLHSPYRHLPDVLSAIRAARALWPGVPSAVLVNGDVFELGNVAALRSAGSADRAFLAALAAEGPTVLNLGNHDGDFDADLGSFVAAAGATGIEAIGNVLDARTGRFYAPSVARIGLGGRRMTLLGLAPDNLNVWPKALRPTLGLLDPVAFAADAAGPAFAGADFAVLASHAGVRADKAILAGLPDGAAVVGGHDHLHFAHAAPGRGYVHAGAWGGSLGMVALREGQAPAVAPVAVAALSEGPDPALAAAIEAVLAEHLTDADRAVIGVRRTAMDLPATILFVAEAVRRAAGADLALLGHTTFGQPLPAGEITRYDLDATVRFDGDIRMAEVSGERLAAMLGRANQHRAASLDQRTGDFVHAAALSITPSARYRVAVNGWTAINQTAYLGADDIAFETVPDLRLKAIAAAAIAAGG